MKYHYRNAPSDVELHRRRVYLQQFDLNVRITIRLNRNSNLAHLSAKCSESATMSNATAHPREVFTFRFLSLSCRVMLGKR